jgi:hypothetical protein
LFNESNELESTVRFRLTYEGPLVSTQEDDLPSSKKEDRRRKQKHDLRKWFHPQLQHLWATHPMLVAKNRPSSETKGESYLDYTAKKFSNWGYNYVPILKKGDPVICQIETLFLRRQMPGGLIRGGDLDNRMKTLYDSLRMPCSDSEMKDIEGPDKNQKPFFVLLEEDNLITHTAIETDILLDLPKNKSDEEMNRVRLIMTVTISPYGGTIESVDWV